eukprot:UN30180
MHNTARHLAMYHALPCMGCVLHTLNIKIQPDHLGYTIKNASDEVIVVDEDLLPQLYSIPKQDLKSVKLIIICGVDLRRSKFSRRNIQQKLELQCDTYDYDDFIEPFDCNFQWPLMNEWTGMGICYTSGTTGWPKGVVFSHRSTFLHTIVQSTCDTIGVSVKDTILLNVPMYHVYR